MFKKKSDGQKDKDQYGKIVGEVVSGLNTENERNAAMRLLSSEKAMETYGILRENEIPYQTIKRIMTHSLHNFQRGKGLTIGSYASGVAEELAHSERYADVVDDMYREGIISEKQYKDVGGTVSKNIKDRSKQLREGLSQLERIAASIPGIFGIGLIIASGTGITGNVIGNSGANFLGIISGIVLLIFSLALFLGKRSFKN